MNKINNLYPIEKQLDYLSSLPKEQIEQYKKILLENKIYPTIQSQKQFSTIINSYRNENNIDIFTRLIKLIWHVSKRKNIKKIQRLLLENYKYDLDYYNNLNNLFKSLKFYKRKRIISQPKFIYYKIIPKILPKINRIMDIGCGNGIKVEELGKLFHLTKENIICADIEKWFSYNNNARKNKNITFLPISETGVIPYSHKVDVITLIHTIHHWCYPNKNDYIKRLSSLNNILADNGAIVIMEHNCITSLDYCLNDIEHGLYEINNLKNFYKEHKSKYLNYIELCLVMKESGFYIDKFYIYNEGNVLQEYLPTKTYCAIFKKIRS